MSSNQDPKKFNNLIDAPSTIELAKVYYNRSLCGLECMDPGEVFNLR